MAIAAPPPVARDDDARAFMATFIAHVETLAGYGKNRRATINGISSLLSAAIAGGDDTGGAAWSALYRAIDDLLDGAFYARDTRDAYAYLRAFIQENGDLAHA